MRGCSNTNGGFMWEGALDSVAYPGFDVGGAIQSACVAYVWPHPL